ncbi:hypothetical protein HMI54_005291, partial [Coelomomyces lativittatus]
KEKKKKKILHWMELLFTKDMHKLNLQEMPRFIDGSLNPLLLYFSSGDGDPILLSGFI